MGDSTEELDSRTLSIMAWISEYLARHPRLQELFALMAQADAYDILSQVQHPNALACVQLQALRRYADKKEHFGDWDENEDSICSWQLLEKETPANFPRGRKSEQFKVCLELRTQSVLALCTDRRNGKDVTITKETWTKRVERNFISEEWKKYLFVRMGNLPLFQKRK